MRIYIEDRTDGWYVCQGDDAEIIAGPFDTYAAAEAALNDLNPEDDDTYETNR